MNPTEPSESVVSLTRDEFEKLPEYSATLPTGVVIGKCWRRKMRANQWIIGEYVASATKEHHAEVRWSRLKILDEAPVSPLAPVGEPRCPVPLAAGERDDILIAFAEACPKPSAAQIIEWCERYPSLAEDIRDHAAIRRDWKAREEIDEAKSLRTAAARPVYQPIEPSWIPTDIERCINIVGETAPNLASGARNQLAALRTASAAQTPVSRETLAKAIWERYRSDRSVTAPNWQGEAWEDTNDYQRQSAYSAADGCLALLASPPQAAAQTGERERALEEAAKAVRAACAACGGTGSAGERGQVLVGEVTRDMARDAGEPSMEGMPVYGDGPESSECEYCGRPIAAIRSLASPASGKETP